MDQVLDRIESNREEIIQLLRQMVQIPSPTFHEGQLAEFVERKLKDIGMATFTDPLGDVTGVANGQSDMPLFLLNTHLDQAEPGDMADPFSGEIMDGEEFGVSGKVVYGRGTNGQKASLAAMIHAAQTVLDLQVPLRRGFAINAGVMEECGGHLSPQYLLEWDKLPVSSVLCGEHTDLRPVNRQRGMIHIHLRITGKGGHAAAPEGSSSALSGMAKVILALDQLREELPKDETYGNALVSLNKLTVIPNVVNAIPDICDAVVDVRHPITMAREEIVPIIQSGIAEAVALQEGLQHTAEVKKQPVTSYTGLEEQADGGMLPFFTPKDDPLVVALMDSIQEITGDRPEPELWTISSEAGYFSTVAGLPVVAFGPGEDRFTHNRYEHVKVEDMIVATKVYASMILKMCQ